MDRPCDKCKNRDSGCKAITGCAAYVAYLKEVRTTTAIQREIREISVEVDGSEFTDLQLAEQIEQDRIEKKRYSDAEKRHIKELAQRMVERVDKGELAPNENGVLELELGEGETARRLVLSHKRLKDYDQTKLSQLRKCASDENIFLVFKQMPSGKQLQALQKLVGAAAKSIIDSSKEENETDVLLLKIKKPRKKSAGRGRGGAWPVAERQRTDPRA